MRIGIDVRYLSHGLVGGVHSYVAHFVPALIDLAKDHEIYLYADTKRPFELRDLPEYVSIRLLPYRTPVSSMYHDFFLYRQMHADRLDVAHFPANYGFGPPNARTIITLHDVLNLLPLPEIWRGLAHSVRNARSLATMTYLHWCTRLALTRANRVLTVSEYSRHAISQHSGIDINRIFVAPNAPAPNLARVVDAAVLEDVRRRHQLARPFVLADALKNPGSLVAAWRLLPAEVRDQYQIVFFSRRSNLLPVVQDAVDSGSARLVMRPSDADLAALYSMADVFVFPSRYEGFGLPVIEAMMCGAPVIASDVCSIPEVAGGAAVLVKPSDSTKLVEHLTCILTRPEEARALRVRGFARAAEYSWQKTAQRILESYTSVVRHAQPGQP